MKRPDSFEEVVPNDEAAQLEDQVCHVAAIIAGALVIAVIASAWLLTTSQGLDPIGQPGPSRAGLPQIGQPAPDLAVTVIDNHGRAVDRIHLSDLKGQPIWLNFWGSWCQPCREEMPGIQAAYTKLEPRGLVWLAVSLDEPAEDAAAFAARNNATFLIASDPNRTDSGPSYSVSYFPTHILIDEQGIVRDIVIAALDQEEIVKRAERILSNE
jgi:peroxiredoxin